MSSTGRRALAAVSLVLVAAWAAGAENNLVRRVDEVVRAEMKRQKIPGMAVAVVRDGTVLLASGYGLANVELQVPVTDRTIFQSGSVGKQFTAAAVMLLVEEGRIQLDAPVTTYLPDAPSPWRAITIRHLLTHTSGLPDYTNDTFDYRRDYDEDELRRFAYALDAEFPAGARWNYSNTGYVLLGIIVRKVSGQFYGDVLRERVFEPLGMRSARVISEADIVPNRAAGYRLVDGELKNQNWVAPSLNTTADGALYVSLRDMIAWDAGLRERKVLRSASWTQVFEPVRLSSGRTYPYGFGWAVDQVSGHPVQRHGGSWQGFKADIARYPDDKLTIIVLANLAQADPGKVSDAIVAVIDPALAPPTPKPLANDDPQMQSRVRRLLAEAASGRLSREEFAYVRAGYFPAANQRFQKMLTGAGQLQKLVLLSRRELGDDTVSTYDAHFARRIFKVGLAVAPDGRLADFRIAPNPDR